MNFCGHAARRFIDEPIGTALDVEDVEEEMQQPVQKRCRHRLVAGEDLRGTSEILNRLRAAAGPQNETRWAALCRRRILSPYQRHRLEHPSTLNHIGSSHLRIFYVRSTVPDRVTLSSSNVAKCGSPEGQSKSWLPPKREAFCSGTSPTEDRQRRAELPCQEEEARTAGDEPGRHFAHRRLSGPAVSTSTHQPLESAGDPRDTWWP